MVQLTPLLLILRIILLTYALRVVGREMSWIAVGASMFSSNIGAEHFIGLAGTGASVGIVVGSFEWQAPFILVLLGYVFVPIYLSSKVWDFHSGFHVFLAAS